MADADVGRGEVDYPSDLCVFRRIMRSAMRSPMHMLPRRFAVKNELIIRWIWVFNHHRCFADCDFAPLTGYLLALGYHIITHSSHFWRYTRKKTQILHMQGFRNLKFVNFSTSYSITGAFLKYVTSNIKTCYNLGIISLAITQLLSLGCPRNLDRNVGGDRIEVLILRDCIHLKQIEVSQLLSSLIVGDFKHLRLLDISNRECVTSDDDWCRRYSNTSFMLKGGQIFMLSSWWRKCLTAPFG